MRAMASGNAGAPDTAFLSLTINASDVTCADGATYRCELFDFSGGVDIVNDTYVEVQGNHMLLFIILQIGIPRRTLEIVIQEVLWSTRGSYSAIWNLPLANVEWHSDPWPTVTSQPIRLSTNLMTFIPSLTFTELWVFSIEHLVTGLLNFEYPSVLLFCLQRVWHASRESLPF